VAQRRGATRKFVRDVFFSNLPIPFLKLRTYLYLVVFARALGPAGYGAWSLFMVTLGIATTLGTMNFGSSMMRFLSGNRTLKETNQGLSTVLLSVAVCSSVIGVILCTFSGNFASAIFRQSDKTLVLLVAVVLSFDCVYEEMRGYLRARRLNRTWAFFSLSRIVPEALLTVAIGWWLRSVTAIVWTYLICGVLAAAIGMLYLINLRNFRFTKPSRPVLRRYAWFGLALLPGGLAYSLSVSADRYIVGYFLDLKQVGIYSVCFTISALGFFLVGPINDVLLPEMSTLYDAGDWDDFHRRFSGIQRFVFGFSVGATALLVVFPQHVLRILTTRDFYSGSYTLAILGLQGVFMSLLMLYIVMLQVRLRVWSTSLIWVGIGGVVVLIEIILLPRIGLLGAGLAQLVSSIAGAALVIGLNWQLFRRTFLLSWVFQTGMAFAAVYATAFFWPSNFAGFFPSVARLAVATATFVLGLAVTGYLGLSDVKLLKESLFLTNCKPEAAASYKAFR